MPERQNYDLLSDDVLRAELRERGVDPPLAKRVSRASMVTWLHADDDVRGLKDRLVTESE
ncbi:MAG: hypothetical protein QOH58_107 [Thermoleophilaceae bacterium]|jgi:DNA-binding transcriptional regulator YdaS (Cro superfamily)|nr:hypothetical protein [Thermoleophilaceae bacterium]